MKNEKTYKEIAKELEQLRTENTKIKTENVALSEAVVKIYNIKTKEKTLKIRLATTKTSNNYHFSVNSLFSQDKLKQIVDKYKTSDADENNCFIVSEDFDLKLFEALKTFCENMTI